jgi:glycosyltransferase involved in cell wall biosynthesis
MNDEGALDQYYAAISKCNFVWVIHDLHAYHYPDQWSPKDLHLMRRRFLQLAKSASAIIVHNDYTADDAAEKLSIERDRISVVRLPAIFAEKEKYVAKSTDADLLCSLGVTAPYALWASSSTYSHKNHECLLHAWRLLADRNCIIPLICTGSKGPRWEKVSRCISELNLEQHVQFTGPVSDEALVPNAV